MKKEENSEAEDSKILTEIKSIQDLKDILAGKKRVKFEDEESEDEKSEDED